MPQVKNAASETSSANMLESASEFVKALIEQARMLEGERGELMSKIGKNRDQLRNLDELGALDDEQGGWLEAFYPAKERGEQRSKQDIEDTRKVKEEARKAYKAANA